MRKINVTILDDTSSYVASMGVMRTIFNREEHGQFVSGSYKVANPNGSMAYVEVTVNDGTNDSEMSFTVKKAKI